MNKITQKQAHEMIMSQNNHVFGVTFEKKGGSIRSMSARLGVEKFRHGGANSTAHLPNIVTAFEMDKKQYRKFDITRLRSLRCNKGEYTVLGKEYV